MGRQRYTVEDEKIDKWLVEAVAEPLASDLQRLVVVTSGTRQGTSVDQKFNIYCDESGHLEHEGASVTVLGAVWCLREKSREDAERVRELKRRMAWRERDLHPRVTSGIEVLVERHGQARSDCPVPRDPRTDAAAQRQGVAQASADGLGAVA